MAKVEIGGSISKSIEIYKKDFIAHIVATIIVSVLSNVAFGILIAPLSVGYMKGIIMAQEQGRPFQIGDIFSGFNDFVPSLVVLILGVIIVCIGFALCFIPGLLVMSILPAAFYLVAAGEKDGVNAIKKAWKAMLANMIPALIALIILSVLSSLGVVLCFIGLIFTLPLIYIGQHVVAQQMCQDDAVATA